MPDIPHYKLHFKSFPEIMAVKYRRELLVDIIGVVYDIKPSKQSAGGKKTTYKDEIVTNVGTPHHVLTATHGWFLLTCANCKKQIITTSPPYECSSKHVTANPKIKYKVEVEVRFQDQKVRFVFWDRECEQLIGKTAEELKNIMVKAGEFDSDEYPADLDDMMGKELVFKVKTQPYYKLVSVLNYKTEETIIQYLKDQIPNNEVKIMRNLFVLNK
ncbi:unnamed protein product [Trifolium pratense]|uniref:Uncharacterized protein n=1 Tax=Trifolium pratense TaxID=57577 RepID=A0ACB0I6Z3_TRIPR|nr:unnamed protein product [Trifolium pratense]